MPVHGHSTLVKKLETLILSLISLVDACVESNAGMEFVVMFMATIESTPELMMTTAPGYSSVAEVQLFYPGRSAITYSLNPGMVKHPIQT